MILEGLVLINKTKDVTSRHVINNLNHIFNMKRIGHTGTLDPLATGVLVVCFGKYTKLVDLITSLDKEYIASVKLGIKTDTGDITGNIISKKEYSHITKEDIINVLNSFIGKSKQTVPSYSAVRIDGMKLYEYARENIKIDLPVRDITINSIELLTFSLDTFTFKVNVSKGTYIRSLIEDIASKLNTVGTMNNLIRTKQGKFNIEDSFTIEDIKNNNFNLLTVKDIFDYPIIDMNEELYFSIKNGKQIKNIFNIKSKVIFTYENTAIAIYESFNDLLKIDIML
ncbi:MAG: tRNA pseudouridine(55) synthase TruB [Bacilli bacterium]